MTVLEQLRAVIEATEARRRAGKAMTYPAGQLMLQHSPELVRLAMVVGDYLAGDVPRAALAGAFAPLVAVREAAAS